MRKVILFLMLIIPVVAMGQNADDPTYFPLNLNSAKPASLPSKPWYKDWKPIALLVADLGSSAAFSLEAHECRKRWGIAFCEGGYGEIRARDVVQAVGAFGTWGVGMWGRHQGIRGWWLPGAGLGTYYGIGAYRQTIVGCPADEVPVYGTKFTCEPEYGWDSTAHRLITMKRH